MAIISKRLFILAVFFFVVINKKVICKPFFTGLFETGPTTPESHISDYHNQPKAEQQQIAIDENDNKISEQRHKSGNTIYPEIIGNIFNVVRERITNVVGNLLSSRAGLVGDQQNERQIDQMKQEIKQSNKKVSPLSLTRDVGMNYEHQNKLNLENTKKLESQLSDSGKNDDNKSKIVEQIKDGEMDKRGEAGINLIEMNNKKISLNYDDDDEKTESPLKNVTVEQGRNEIIDAFFDLDSDDIFYEIERNSSNQKIVQRPRLFPLILSSLVKYRNQSDMGFLQNTTVKERNRIRALYMLRPIIGVLRRKAENTRVRQQLREMEKIMANMMVLTTKIMNMRNNNETIKLSMAQEQLTQQQKDMQMRAKLAFSHGFDRHFKRVATKSHQPTMMQQQREMATMSTYIQKLIQQDISKFDENNNNTIIEEQKRNFHSNNNSFEQENNNDEDVDDDDDDDNDDNSSDESKSNLAFGETFGILILELIGTVAGLTWGAFSQLSHYIQGMGN